MNLTGGSRLAVRLGVAAALVGLCAGRAPAQDPDVNLDPTFGTVKLKAGFEPDPYKKKLVAGGPLKTNLGGVNAYVAKAPDVKLHYEAGKYPLIIYAVSKVDTTLLINLPDGKWVADDDSGGNLNPLLRWAKPQSGRYDIYVGTFGKDNADATLYITEIETDKAKEARLTVPKAPRFVRQPWGHADLFLRAFDRDTAPAAVFVAGRK
jgi:hypothetical protein